MPVTGIIIQVRTGSTRLPYKVILPFYKNKSILDILLEKMIQLNNEYLIILATTNKKEDDVIVDFAKKYKVEFYRGDEYDVLSRFTEAANYFKIDTIIRICADNPFIDIENIKLLKNIFYSIPNLDYCSYKNHLGRPVVKTHIGLFSEVVSLNALKKVQFMTKDTIYKEHVTNFIYENPKKFNIHLEESFLEVFYRDDLRFTVDDIEDFQNLGVVFDYYINVNFNIKKTISFVDENSIVKNLMINNIKKYTK